MEARANMQDGWKDPHNNGKYDIAKDSTSAVLAVDHYGGNFPHFHDKVNFVFEARRRLLSEKAAGCTVYACSDSQGISAADGSTNYCNIRNLYANESQDKVPPVNTNLNYHEKSKKSQLGGLDLQKSACNTMKKNDGRLFDLRQHKLLGRLNNMQ